MLFYQHFLAISRAEAFKFSYNFNVSIYHFPTVSIPDTKKCTISLQPFLLLERNEELHVKLSICYVMNRVMLMNSLKQINAITAMADPTI